MEKFNVSSPSSSDSRISASDRTSTFSGLAGAIIITVVALAPCMARARELVAPSLGMFAINEQGLSKLEESGTAEALQNGEARIRVRFFRFGSRGDWNELRGFLVNLPSVSADRLQVWRTTCDIYQDQNCVGDQRPTPTEITRTAQDGVFVVKILGDNGKPSTLANHDSTKPLYIFIGAPAVYAAPQPVWGVVLFATK